MYGVVGRKITKYTVMYVLICTVMYSPIYTELNNPSHVPWKAIDQGIGALVCI
jgi:hypothetical protein